MAENSQNANPDDYTFMSRGKQSKKKPTVATETKVQGLLTGLAYLSKGFKNKNRTRANPRVAPNFGNQSGLGPQTAPETLINRRRAARGASLINQLPGLANTTGRGLFGL